MIQAVIFDMDGVIIDSEPIHFESDRLTMRDFGIEISDEELNSYVGIPNPVMLSELRIKYSLPADLEELLYRQTNNKRLLFGCMELEPIEGIRELLAALKSQEIGVGLASSSSRDFIEMILNSLNLREYFEVIVSGDEVENGKPAPDIFLKAAGELGVKPCNCLVIEDSEHGVRASKLAGMSCIGFKNPNSGPQDLSEADRIITKIGEIRLENI